ncbi:helix-turn-helix domain-containing protein [Pseudomonas sp. AO-1]|uniref:helix-turn-helix domain-containing protein n=1 Tax=Pseudomonas sp. AO-1 TaxID=2855434 RepID=UPI001C795068|nr:helix-turn-helix domain-containing protein [Pseudomonas sp. AO-1]
MTLISIAETAILLGIGRTTAYRLAKEGRIPSVRSFGPLRIHAEKLQSMIDAEAEASIAPESGPIPICSISPPCRSRAGGSLSSAQASRKLDELLKPKPKSEK